MDKEKILELSRKENTGTDEMELSELGKAGRIASIVGMLLCLALFTLEYLVFERANPGYFLIWTGIQTTIFACKSVRLHIKHEIALTIIFALLFLCFMAMYISSLTIK